MQPARKNTKSGGMHAKRGLQNARPRARTSSRRLMTLRRLRQSPPRRDSRVCEKWEARATTAHGYRGSKIRQARCARVCSRRGSAPNTLPPASGCDDTRGHTPSRGTGEEGRSPIWTPPHLGGRSHSARCPTRSPPCARFPTYLRLVVISGVGHGYAAPELRGRERKTCSAPGCRDRKSRPAQALAGSPSGAAEELMWL